MVSSDYHIEPRVKEILNFLYGDDYDIECEGVESGLISDPQTIKTERESLEKFYRLFEGMHANDDEAVEERLFEEHPLCKERRISTFD